MLLSCPTRHRRLHAVAESHAVVTDLPPHLCATNSQLNNLPRFLRQIAALFLAFGVVLPVAAVSAPLEPVPDPAFRRSALGHDVAELALKSFTCPEPPSPVLELSIESAYRPEDPTQSQVERSREEEYARRVEALRAFTDGVNRRADEYVRTRPRDGRIASCLASWLELWARNRAMLPDSITAQGNAERKWNLVAFSLSYTMTADAPEIDTVRRGVIENWLRQLGQAWMSGPDYSKERPNNHLNWGGLALMATGVATQDRHLFDRGLDLIRQALNQVAADGSLPLESARGSRSIGYHGFALDPLVVAAELAKPNGVDLYLENNGALERLAQFMKAIMLDPDIVTRRVGVVQDWPATPSKIGPISWAWAIPYTARTKDEQLEAIIRKFPNDAFYSQWLGNVALRFGNVPWRR